MVYLTYRNGNLEDSNGQALVHIVDSLDITMDEDQSSSLQDPVLENANSVKSNMTDLSNDDPMQLQVSYLRVIPEFLFLTVM